MKHILVVDDESEVRKVICALLESCGYTTQSASNGHEAMALVNEVPFDLVITDLVMPEMEGVETMAALRRTLPDLRVVAMSGRDSYLQMARTIGARMTLLKPFSREQLHEAVEAALAA